MSQPGNVGRGRGRARGRQQSSQQAPHQQPGPPQPAPAAPPRSAATPIRQPGAAGWPVLSAAIPSPPPSSTSTATSEQSAVTPEPPTSVEQQFQSLSISRPLTAPPESRSQSAASSSPPKPGAPGADNGLSLKPISRPIDPKTGNFLYCTLGRPVKTIVTNHFVMKIDPENSPLVYRYDVEILPSRINKVKKREIMDAAWKDAGHNFGCRTPAAYGYDGNKLLYSSVEIKVPTSFDVNLRDGEKIDNFKVEILKLTENGILRLADLLRDDIADTSEILAALDVVLLTNPKAKYPTNLRRSFYYPLPQPCPLRDGFKEIWAGFYSSARQGEWTLTLNVDVTASVVIQPLPLIKIYENCRRDARRMQRQLQESKRDLKIYVEFGGRPHQKRIFQGIVQTKTAETHRFQDESKRRWTILEYYREKYGVNINYPDYPLVQVKSGKIEVLFPMEFCEIVPGQLSVTKRESDDQAQLVRYMSSMKPAERLQRTKRDFVEKFATPEQRDLLRQLGITVETEPMPIREARVLPPVTMQAGDPKPLQSDRREPGKFTLGNRFFKSQRDIGKWAVVETSGELKQNDVREWIDLFRQGLQRKSISAAQEPIIEQATTAEQLAMCFDKLVANQVTFIVFLVQSKGVPLYGCIKQLGDRKFSIVTQCVDIGKWQKMNNAYMDNLVLKVNVKLGGINFILSNDTFTRNNLPPMFDEPVLLVGADVTHPGADEKSKPSIAAVVGSIDRHATIYKSVITAQSRTTKEDQTCTQEWISDICETMKTLLKAYKANTGQKPVKIIIYRDGVSEGQYPIVLRTELSQIQQACRDLQPDYKPAITYIVVRKRIKTKFFNVEQAGRVVNNVDPGTIVEVDITQPIRFFDWYLVPHNSPLGTAKPTHYVVIYDDSHFSPNEIGYLSFALCHLFPRCPKAVSLPAPVYHAHLAAERANYHLAGQPFVPPKNVRDQALLKQQQLQHTRDVTEMGVGSSKPNYWL